MNTVGGLRLRFPPAVSEFLTGHTPTGTHTPFVICLNECVMDDLTFLMIAYPIKEPIPKVRPF